MADLEELKERARQLWLTHYYGDEKKVEEVKGEIKLLLKDLVEMSQKVETKREYNWITETVARWELQLVSEFGENTDYRDRIPIRGKELQGPPAWFERNKDIFLENLLSDIITRTPYWITAEGRLHGAVAAGLLFTENSFLLTKLNKGPLSGFWSLPSGYVKESETLDIEVLLEEIQSQISEIIKREETVRTLVSTSAFEGFWEKNVQWGIETNYLPTTIHVLRLNVDDKRLIATGKETKWCTPKDVQNLHGKTHPIVLDVLKREFSEHELAEKLESEASKDIQQSSKWKKISESCAEDIMDSSRKYSFLQQMEEIIEEPPVEESLSLEDQRGFERLTSLIATNIYNDKAFKDIENKIVSKRGKSYAS